ncbi:thioredoxin family protein [Candidatus Woesearchaeota archaeon]|nr:thioredoxin family protein [Candidatus Woesearchaeota archaeon]
MKSPNFIQRPFLALIVVIFVIASILYIESQKPKTGKIPDQPENESKYPRAPDFAGIDRWINSEPLNIAQLRGKVVLVDFWTYTCINCIRTLPYLKDWDKKYSDKGLTIVGVHTPEFGFEKKYENVLKAVNDYKLKYAVAQDNNYVTWNLYQNRYWPHKYLIDIDGYIRYDHIGEGNYEETEKMIQTLLHERMGRLNQKGRIDVDMTHPSGMMNLSPQDIGTPELYFGYQFDRGNLGYQGLKPNEIVDFKFPARPFRNFAYLDGAWKYNADNMELISDDGSILLIFKAKDVNIVAGSESNSTIFVFLNNQYLDKENEGMDIAIEGNKSMSKAGEFRLYNIVSGKDYDEKIIQMDVFGKGFKIYTFTFG